MPQKKQATKKAKGKESPMKKVAAAATVKPKAEPKPKTARVSNPKSVPEVRTTASGQKYVSRKII